MKEFQVIARDLIRALRGKASCTRLSQRLGYSFNQVSRWERGMKTILWRDLVRLATLQKRDVRRALVFAQFLQTDPDRIEEILGELIGQEPIPLVAARIGISPSILRRWLNGQTAVPLAAVLKLLDQFRKAAADFAAQLAPIEQVPGLYAAWKRQERERSLHMECPEAAILIRYLELGEYFRLRLHNDEWLSKKTGLSVATVKAILKRLRETGAIRRKRKKYVVASERLNVLSVEQMNRLKRYWLENAIRAFDSLPDDKRHGPGSNFFGYNVFSISELGWSRILKLYSEFYADLRNVLKEDQPGQPSRVKIFTVQFVDSESRGSN